MARYRRSHWGNPWLSIATDAMTLGFEAATVIGLRTARIAMGGAAGGAEAELMVAEKIKAASELQMLAATGGLGLDPHSASRKVLSHYGRKVRANRRRLSKG